jgi:hypothetical protein
MPANQAIKLANGRIPDQWFRLTISCQHHRNLLLLAFPLPPANEQNPFETQKSGSEVAR